MANTQTTAGNKAPRAPRGGKKQAEAPLVTGPRGKVVPAPATDAAEVPPEQRQGERRQQQTNAMAQFVSQQLDTPSAHVPDLTEEQRKAIAFQEEMKALAEKYGVPAPVLATTPATPQAQQRQARSDRQEKNGVTRPGAETLTGKVWATADEISAKNTQAGGQYATIAEVRDALGDSVNEATIRTQYARWRTYNGLKGRQQPQERVQPEGQDEGIEAAYNGPERRANP